jgi:hypothetical protein
VVRWVEELQQYGPDIQYVRGADNPVADGLSRSGRVNAVAADTSAPSEEEELQATAARLLDRIKEKYAADAFTSRILAEFGDGDRHHRWPRFSRQDDLLFY